MGMGDMPHRPLIFTHLESYFTKYWICAILPKVGSLTSVGLFAQLCSAALATICFRVWAFEEKKLKPLHLNTELIFNDKMLYIFSET